jgi:hypothetical protein
MICGRSATLMLVASALLGGTSRGSETANLPTERAAYLTAGHLESSTILPHFRLPTRGSTLSHFTPWKTRIKSVLGESYERIVDEGSLGLAILPQRLVTSATIEFGSSPLPFRPPLRC